MTQSVLVNIYEPAFVAQAALLDESMRYVFRRHVEKVESSLHLVPAGAVEGRSVSVYRNEVVLKESSNASLFPQLVELEAVLRDTKHRWKAGSERNLDR